MTGVEYLDANGREQRVLARTVVIAAHAVETPRLLLMSANGRYPDGLANSSGEVGRRFMSHPTWQVFGTFDDPINAYKGMQMGHVMVQDYYAPDPRRGCARGFVLLSYMMTPITYANLSGSFFGADFKQFLFDYTHGRVVGACGGPARRAQHGDALPHREGRTRPAGRAGDVWVGRQRRDACRRRARQGGRDDERIGRAPRARRLELRRARDGLVPEWAAIRDRRS